MGSLSAVSEAPARKNLLLRWSVWALQIQRLEGSRWLELWALYLVGPVLMAFAVAVGSAVLECEALLEG
jgi:hypothetical protein